MADLDKAQKLDFVEIQEPRQENNEILIYLKIFPK